MKAAILVFPVACFILLMESCMFWDAQELIPDLGIPPRHVTQPLLAKQLEEVVQIKNPEILTFWSEERMRSYYTQEQIDVLREECEENCGEYPKLWPIVAAIGRSENGATHAFGILNSKANTWRKQAGWCAATVRKNYDRWLQAEPMNHKNINAYIEFLGKRYCPVGADNDPTGLNQHWIKNVTWYTNLYSK